MDADFLAERPGERVLQRLLDRRLGTLALPSTEARAVIGDSQRVRAPLHRAFLVATRALVWIR